MVNTGNLAIIDEIINDNNEFYQTIIKANVFHTLYIYIYQHEHMVRSILKSTADRYMPMKA